MVWRAKIECVPADKGMKYLFAVAFRLRQNANSHQRGVFFISRLMVRLPVKFHEKRSDKKDDSIKRLFKLGRVSAKCDGCKKYHKITHNKCFGDLPTVIIEPADAGCFYPTVKTSRAMGNVKLMKSEGFGIPVIDRQLIHNHIMNIIQGLIMLPGTI